jgi:23S rRNA (guanosine2251-2'-O)-methyltransferase
MRRVVAGPNATRVALDNDPDAISVVYVARGLNPGTLREIEALCKRSKTRCEALDREALDGICKGLNHQGVAAIGGDFPYVDVETVMDVATRSEAPLLVVLDQIQDTGNLGAIVRSAHSLGAAGLVITRDRSATVTAATVRSSAGATECTMIARATNLARTLARLKDSGFTVLGAAMDGDPIDQVDMSPPCALVFGNEAKGLRRLTREGCDRLFSIPMAGGFESLNVSAAAAISLYVASRSGLS